MNELMICVIEITIATNSKDFWSKDGLDSGQIKESAESQCEKMNFMLASHINQDTG